MTKPRQNYPDNSDIHARKAEGRKQRAAISFAEKLAAVDELRARVAPIVRAREARKRQQTKSPA
ncbi:MAG TPA: hypothetical protein VG889_18620 [Rhizomicrobium sp.]|nr:hypothetical protein [Rhizomicrobium sp.]